MRYLDAAVPAMLHGTRRFTYVDGAGAPYASAAIQHWVYNSKPAILVRDQGRYLRLDPAERVARLKSWNRPVWWPTALGALAIAALFLFALRSFRRRERMNARGEILPA